MVFYKRSGESQMQRVRRIWEGRLPSVWRTATSQVLPWVNGSIPNSQRGNCSRGNVASSPDYQERSRRGTYADHGVDYRIHQLKSGMCRSIMWESSRFLERWMGLYKYINSKIERYDPQETDGYTANKKSLSGGQGQWCGRAEAVLWVGWGCNA